MNNYRIVYSVLLAGIILAPAQNLVALSETTNPLEIEIDQSDPLIPPGYKKRELSTFEINRIKREMDRLERNANQELQQDEANKAFKLWYRQLRLARAVGIETEISALAKVGEIAWQANRGEDLRNIANRLQMIESEIDLNSAPRELLEQFATAYQQIRYSEQAIAIYRQILSSDRARSNLAAVESNLKTLGELYLARFDYAQAAETYEELLALAESQSQTDGKIDFLETLADIYDRTAQTKLAIATKQSLIQSYTAADKTAKLAKLELAIARDYQTLGKVQKATTAYNRAFSLAEQEQQIAIANDALMGLGRLYQEEGEDKKAITTFKQVIEIQRQSYNYYGLIDTYDTLGKISLRSSQNKQAKQYFQQALKLARELDYRINYFVSQIDKI